mmetsp:Transcript_4541/g.8261  ORF Transcript_4541/g.8261 Transcript_4541/m.8261 type:complete len:282 (+) Transcript_4541:682-1527(+)
MILVGQCMPQTSAPNSLAPTITSHPTAPTTAPTTISPTITFCPTLVPSTRAPTTTTNPTQTTNAPTTRHPHTYSPTTHPSTQSPTSIQLGVVTLELTFMELDISSFSYLQKNNFEHNLIKTISRAERIPKSWIDMKSVNSRNEATAIISIISLPSEAAAESFVTRVNAAANSTFNEENGFNIDRYGIPIANASEGVTYHEDSSETDNSKANATLIGIIVAIGVAAVCISLVCCWFHRKLLVTQRRAPDPENTSGPPTDMTRVQSLSVATSAATTRTGREDT